MELQVNKTTYTINPTKGRYVALYSRHHRACADVFDSLEDATDCLDYGSEYGELFAIGIYDLQDRKTIINQNHARAAGGWVKAGQHKGDDGND